MKNLRLRASAREMEEEREWESYLRTMVVNFWGSRRRGASVLLCKSLGNPKALTRNINATLSSNTTPYGCWAPAHLDWAALLDFSFYTWVYRIWIRDLGYIAPILEIIIKLFIQVPICPHRQHPSFRTSGRIYFFIICYAKIMSY